jgi:hypothetical protein
LNDVMNDGKREPQGHAEAVSSDIRVLPTPGFR